MKLFFSTTSFIFFITLPLFVFAGKHDSVFVHDTQENTQENKVYDSFELAEPSPQYSDTKVDTHTVNSQQVHVPAKGALANYKRKHFNLYSIKDDIRLGEAVQKEQLREFQKKKVPIDPPAQAALKTRIEKIVHRLAKVSDQPNLPYEVHIYDKKDIVNAFCLPGGKIGIFTGIFDKEKGLIDPKNDDQIAAVLGHEMAHASLRHITRRIGTMQGLGIVGTVASVALGEGFGLDARRFFDQVYSQGINFYLPNYSRKHEKEADRAGFYYLAKAGFNPQAAIDIWQKAASKGGRNSNKTDFFASHPADAERAKALKGWLLEAEMISRNRN